MDQQRLTTSRSIFAPFKDWPIAGKLLLVVLVPLILTLVTTLTLTITGLNQLETETSTDQLQQEIGVIRQQFATAEADLLLNASELTGNSVVLETLQRDDLQALKGFLLSVGLREGFNHLEVVDTEGQTLFVHRNFDLGQASPDLKRLHDIGLLDVTDATTLVPTPSGWLLATVRSIKLPSGAVIGALSIGRLLDEVTLSALNFGRSNPILVVFDAEGNVISTSKAEHDPEAGPASNLAGAFKVDQNLWAGAAGGETLLGQGQVRGEPHRIAYAPLVIKDQNAAVFGVALSTVQTTDLRNQLAITNLAVVGVLGLLTILSALFLGRRYIIRPITALASGAEQIAAGQLDAALPDASSQDELGRLTTTFNQMANQLRQTLTGLAHRNQSLETFAVLSERLNAILDLDELLAKTVNQIKDNFGYYHTHIYLLDDQREKLVMTAGAGAAGVEMKAKGHHIRLNAPTSLVARAARSGEIVRVDNVREAKDWLPNPLLPETYSEMAVPIILDDQVVGVLDVQQDKIAGLNEADARLLRILANQVAVGIRNAHQFAKVNAALAEARELQERYLEQAWDSTKIGQHTVGQVRFSLAETTLDEQTIERLGRQALAHRAPTVVNLATDSGTSPYQTLVAPVVLQNTTIGDLQLYDADPNRQWTESDLALVNTIIDQVAQSAENLRLFEETRERAGREQMIRQITDKLRAAPNLQRLVEIATQELAQRLPATHAKLELGLQAEHAQNGNGKSNFTEVEPL